MQIILLLLYILEYGTVIKKFFTDGIANDTEYVLINN